MSVSTSLKKAATVTASPETMQYLTFLLSGEMFAINIQHVREIIEYDQPTVVPLMPKFIRGVMNIRGAVVPVVDLSARLHGNSSEPTRRTCVIIVEVGAADEQRDMGIVVDAVSAVLDIPTADIEPPPTFGTHIRSDFIEGMGKVNDKFVIILNASTVLMAGENAAANLVAEAH